MTVAVYMAKTGCSKARIREEISKNYYALDFTLDSIRDSYAFDYTCEGSIPQAIVAFLESADFEDAIRGSISIGGDSDTIAAIAGAIAEVFYGVPDEARVKALSYMDEYQTGILTAFEKRFLNQA